MKTTFGYYLSNFCVHISFEANVLFLHQSIEVSIEEKIGLKILKKFRCTWRMTNKFS